jgi:hypothetical protein
MKSLGEGESPVRTIRVTGDLWQAFKEACRARGVSASEALRCFMVDTVTQHRSKQD